MYGFKIDKLDKENNIVFFSSPMSSFSSSYSFYESDDVSMDGEIETQITAICVMVRNMSSVYIDTDGTDGGDIILDVMLTDKMCREVAALIEKEI